MSDDVELVKRALELAGGTNHHAAQRIGVSEETVRLWRAAIANGEYITLNRSTRPRIELFLAGGSPGTSDYWRGAYESARNMVQALADGMTKTIAEGAVAEGRSVEASIISPFPYVPHRRAEQVHEPEVPYSEMSDATRAKIAAMAVEEIRQSEAKQPKKQPAKKARRSPG